MLVFLLNEEVAHNGRVCQWRRNQSTRVTSTVGVPVGMSEEPVSCPPAQSSVHTVPSRCRGLVIDEPSCDRPACYSTNQMVGIRAWRMLAAALSGRHRCFLFCSRMCAVCRLQTTGDRRLVCARLTDCCVDLQGGLNSRSSLSFELKKTVPYQNESTKRWRGIASTSRHHLCMSVK